MLSQVGVNRTGSKGWESSVPRQAAKATLKSKKPEFKDSGGIGARKNPIAKTPAAENMENAKSTVGENGSSGLRNPPPTFPTALPSMELVGRRDDSTSEGGSKKHADETSSGSGFHREDKEAPIELEDYRFG